MVEAVRTHVNDAGIEPTGFYYEKFALAHGGPAPEADTPAAEADTTIGDRDRGRC